MLQLIEREKNHNKDIDLLKKKLKKVRKLIDAAQLALSEAYQVVVQKDCETDQKNNPISEIVLRRRKKSKNRRVDNSQELS